MRDIRISRVMNGFMVKVGCQTLVFQTQSELLRELDQYLAKPEETEKRFVTQFGLAGGELPVGQSSECNYEPPTVPPPIPWTVERGAHGVGAQRGY